MLASRLPRPACTSAVPARAAHRAALGHGYRRLLGRAGLAKGKRQRFQHDSVSPSKTSRGMHCAEKSSAGTGTTGRDFAGRTHRERRQGTWSQAIACARPKDLLGPTKGLAFGRQDQPRGFAGKILRSAP